MLLQQQEYSTQFEQRILECISNDCVEEFTKLFQCSNNSRCNVNSCFGIEQQPILFLAISKQANAISKFLVCESQGKKDCILDVNVTNRIQATALHIAASTNNIEAGMMLLTNPKFRKVNDRDIYGNHALHVAVKSHHLDFVSLLVNIGNVDVNIKRIGCGKTALHLAIEEALPTLVATLLEMGANLHQRDHNNMPACLLLPTMVNHKRSSTILARFVQTDVEFLCSVKDNQKQNILHKIVLANNIFLLRAFALLTDRHNYDQTLHQCDARGYTPIHYACIQANFVMLETLLLMQANLHSKDDSGDTVFHLAAKLYRQNKDNNMYRICKILLESEQGSKMLRLKNSKLETIEELLQKAEFFEDYLCLKAGYNKLIDVHHLSTQQVHHCQQIAQKIV